MGAQDMSFAAVTKQERAQVGRRATSDARSVVVDAEEEVVLGVDVEAAVIVGEVIPVTWAVVAPRRRGRLMSENRIVAIRSSVGLCTRKSLGSCFCETS